MTKIGKIFIKDVAHMLEIVHQHVIFIFYDRDILLFSLFVFYYISDCFPKQTTVVLNLTNLSVIMKLFCFLFKIRKFVSVDFPLHFSLFIIVVKHFNVQFVFLFDGHQNIFCYPRFFD